MADHNRTQQTNQPDRAQKDSSQVGSPNEDEGLNPQRGEGVRNRSTHEPSAIAHDRGVGSERQSFAGDRESDELGSATDGLIDIDDSYESDDDLEG